MKAISYNQAILNSLDKILDRNKRALLMGLGVTDPKAFFGTTTGLVDKFGSHRIIECPTSENAYLGHAMGLSLGGHLPIVHFQRMDFMLYAFDQLINNISKWRDMFDLKSDLPIVIRTLVGMGWGQGAQHSQNFSSIFAQVPGLKVFTPSCPSSAFRLMELAANDGNPVVYSEHRWLQSLTEVKFNEELLVWPLGKAYNRKKGEAITIVAWSYGVAESLRFCELFPELDAEVIDLLTLCPLDLETIRESFKKTKKLILWEPSPEFGGIGAEILAQLCFDNIQGDVLRLGYPMSFPSASPKKVFDYYLSLEKIVEKINNKFKYELKINTEMDWPTDKDLNHWSPWR